MRLGIVGTGNIGATLARKLTKAGHSVLIANSRGPTSLQNLAAETGAMAVTVREVTQGVDVIVLSIPLSQLPRLREATGRLADHVVVADTSNYFPVRDGQIPDIETGQVESLWVSEQIEHPVVKAWNNVLAVILAARGVPTGTAGRIALSVAGDDPASKDTVRSLVEDTGFDAIDGGSLAESWRQQPITRAYCSELPADHLRAALARADRDRAPTLREDMVKAFMALGDRITAEDIVRLHRAASARG
jgi:8-hydroxy-5-deazaflavin:NADPH oxidoreductase